MYLGQNIKLLSSLKGYNGANLAKELGVSSGQMSKYMSGDSTPRMETIIAVAELFDVNLHDLILLDLGKQQARPFEGADGLSPDVQLEELNKLLRQRVNELEREIADRDPTLAKKLGIE
ncbi:MAG: helix-turn-helix transcriptional regulator [Bacteroidota bacterium]